MTTAHVDRIRLDHNGPLVYVRWHPARAQFEYRLRLTDRWCTLQVRSEWPAITLHALDEIKALSA